MDRSYLMNVLEDYEDDEERKRTDLASLLIDINEPMLKVD
jgi:hypothetical protein